MPPVVEALQRLLVDALGSEILATAALQDALGRSGREVVPSDADELTSFAWAHLVAAVIGHIGAQRAAVLMEDLQGAIADAMLLRQSATNSAGREAATPLTEPHNSSIPISSGVRGVGAGLSAQLINADRISRVEIARALLRTGMVVSVADSFADAVHTFNSRDKLDVVYCDLDEVDVAAGLFKLVRAHPRIAVVAVSQSDAVAEAMLRVVGVERHETMAKGTLAPETVARILRMARVTR